MYASHLIICCIHVITWPLWQSCTSILQLTVEPHLLQSRNPYCSLTPTQQKVQWWCSSVSQGLSQREWWQQCVGIMASGYPILEMSPAAPDLHKHPHRHSQRYLHKYQHLCWLLLLLDLVNRYYELYICMYCAWAEANSNYHTLKANTWKQSCRVQFCSTVMLLWICLRAVY